MVIVGSHNLSVVDSSLLGEPQTTISSQHLDPGRSGNRASAILQMWREMADEHGLCHRDQVSEGLFQQGNTASSGSSSGMNASEISSSDHEVTMGDLLVSDDGQSELQDTTTNQHNIDCTQSSDLGEVERERVRKIFREWMSNGARECSSDVSCTSNNSRIVLGERDPSGDMREDQAAQIEQVRHGLISNKNQYPPGTGSTGRGIRKVCGRQVLLDMLKKSERDRQQEIQSLLEHQPVSQFAHRNRIQSLLRGRFLRNESYVVGERSCSSSASELGLLRQRQTVSGLREGFLSRMETRSQASSSLSRTPSSVDDNDNGSDQGHLICLDDSLNGTSGESRPSNIYNNTSELCDIGDDSEVNSGGITVLESTDGGEGRQDPIVENELSSHQRSGSVREGGGVSQDRATTGLSHESILDESPYHSHQVTEAPLVFSASRREETSSSNLLQHADDLGGSIAQNLTGQDSVDVVQQPDHDFENGDHHETTVEPVEQIDATDENVNVNQFGSSWLQDHYVNDDVEGSSYLFELPDDGNQDDDFQEAIQSWLGQPSSQDIVSNTQVRTFYLPDDNNVYNGELQELLSRRSVSNLLSSGFRQSLDQLIQSYVERQGQASDEPGIHENSLQNSTTAEHNLEQLDGDDGSQTDAIGSPQASFPALPVPSMPMQLHWDRDLHRDNWSQHDGHRHLGFEWDTISDLRIDMARLQQRMNDMQRMLGTCMSMQVELQGLIRQEVSAACSRPMASPVDSLNSSSESASDVCETNNLADDSKWEHVRKGVCCICLSSNIDSLLYRCGHMCTCLKCADRLVKSQGKCPMCRAPVVEVIRAYFIS
ncbi:hypothetical protein SAY86_017545 [Trapa natans]|uniref:RING-type domain-containing protein n=1 Tax=Trapa natans TaxID=22666 RepID=A0AAN7LPH9_TRANT|nr:hypothetical protein SAY86_017545 [Trapa natans]